MSETRPTPKSTLGERIFDGFSWPEGRIPPVLAGQPIPLKTGIIEDVKVLLPKEEHEAVQSSVARWTRSMPYLYAMLEPDSWRVDLDGNPVEGVADKHRDHAKGLLEYKQVSKARKQRREVLAALDAIDRIFKEPSRENLAAAKKGSAEIRRILTGK